MALNVVSTTFTRIFSSARIFSTSSTTNGSFVIPFRYSPRIPVRVGRSGVQFFSRDGRTAENGVGENAEFHVIRVDDDDLVQVGQTFFRQIEKFLDIDDG